jgi:hypothetical protein
MNQEVSAIRTEMKAISNELEDIELGIRSDLDFFADELCADRLHTVYEILMRHLALRS